MICASQRCVYCLFFFSSVVMLIGLYFLFVCLRWAMYVVSSNLIRINYKYNNNKKKKSQDNLFWYVGPGKGGCNFEVEYSLCQLVCKLTFACNSCIDVSLQIIQQCVINFARFLLFLYFFKQFLTL